MQGSADIIIASSDLTRLLWRDVESGERFAVHYEDSGMVRDSFRAVARGSCSLQESNFFHLRWSLSRPDGGYEREFEHSGYGLKEAQTAITASLDSFLFTLNITTVPDSAEVYLGQKPLGPSPVTLKDMPLGWYTFTAHKGNEWDAEDSLYLNTNNTDLRLELHPQVQDTFAYVRLQTPPACELYLDGARQTPLGVDLYRFRPGTNEIVLVSRQYGTRRVTIELAPGDTLNISFFNQRQP